MSARALSMPVLFLAVIGALILLSAERVYAMGAAADAMCTGCVWDPKAGANYCPVKFCQDVTAGYSTPGTCLGGPTQCVASGTSGPNGFGLNQVAQILGPLMSALMQNSMNGSNSPTDTSLAVPCQTTPTGIAAQLVASSSTSTNSSGNSNPCYYGYNTTPSTLSSGLLGTSAYSTPTYGSGVASDLTNALSGSSCSDPTTCGISAIADQLTATLAGDTPASSASTTDTTAPTNVSDTTAIPAASSTATTTSSGTGAYWATGSNIAPQGITVEKDGNTLLFFYTPLGTNAQISGFIACDTTSANAVPYIPLSVIQGACQ